MEQAPVLGGVKCTVGPDIARPEEASFRPDMGLQEIIKSLVMAGFDIMWFSPSPKELPL